MIKANHNQLRKLELKHQDKATMKTYLQYLIDYFKGIDIIYLDSQDNSQNFIENITETLEQCDFYDTIDKPVIERSTKLLSKLEIKFEIKENLSYLQHVKMKVSKANYSHDSSFSRGLRRRLNILMGVKGEDHIDI